jgi:two-component system LytT family response regulator
VVKDRGTISFIEQTDIDWVDAAGDYMCIHVKGETHIIRSTLKKLLEQLNPVIFQRIHRSTIVNLERVKKIIPLAKSEYFLELNGDERIKVSRNYKHVVKGLIERHEESSN